MVVSVEDIVFYAGDLLFIRHWWCWAVDSNQTLAKLRLSIPLIPTQHLRNLQRRHGPKAAEARQRRKAIQTAVVAVLHSTRHLDSRIALDLTLSPSLSWSPHGPLR